MSETLQVSAVMTVFNQAEYLAAAIDSVLAQQVFELIVVDDGSTDGSADIVRRYGDRVRLIQQANGGLGAARNTGLAAARGDYLAFCDADDIHLPHRIPAQAYLLHRRPDAAVVFSEFSSFDGAKVTEEFSLRTRKLGPSQEPFEAKIQRFFGPGTTCRAEGVPVPERYLDRRVYTGRVAPMICEAHVAWGGVSLFRRSSLIAIGGHDASLRRYTDWYVVSQLAKSFELIFLDVPVIHYRSHPGQLTKKPALGARCYLDVIDRVWRKDAVFYARNRELVDQIASVGHWQLGTALLGEGDAAGARREFVRSIRLRPQQKRVYLDLARSMLTRAR